MKIFSAFYVSAFLVAAVSLGYKFTGEVTYDGRLEAFFNSPNYLAMYLAPGIIMGIITLAQNQNRVVKLKTFFVFLSLLLMLISFYYTYSYAAWVSVIISLAILAVAKNKHFDGKTCFLLASIAFLSLILTAQTPSEKMNNILFSERSSLESRFIIWRSAGRILADNWLLGIGPGNFQAYYLEYQKYFPLYLE